MCRQAAKQLSSASHRLERDEAYKTFLDFVVGNAGTGMCLLTTVVSPVGHSVLVAQLGETRIAHP